MLVVTVMSKHEDRQLTTNNRQLPETIVPPVLLYNIKLKPYALKLAYKYESHGKYCTTPVINVPIIELFTQVIVITQYSE